MTHLFVACALLAAAPLAHRAAEDPRLSVRVVAVQRLLYRDGADARSDRPAHVRAASGLAWWGERLAIAQDDAAFVAVWDPTTHRVDHIDLPADAHGRRQFDALHGNKAAKLDLESIAAAPDGGLLAFGSGSTPVRDVIVRIGPPSSPGVQVIPLPRVFGTLRARRLLGSELNIEGAALTPDGVRLFQRGNGAPREGLDPVDATVEVRQPFGEPVIGPVFRYDLGRVRGVRLTFTDASPAPGGHTLYLASAEDSPDAVRDGPVAGSVVGVLDAAGVARQAPLAGAWKLEGIALDRTRRDRVYLVADPDDPARPAVLITAELAGPWFRD